MALLLREVLTAEDVDRVRARLEEATWVSGKTTAGASARAVKANAQASTRDPDIAALERFVTDALRRHSAFSAMAWPRRFSRVLFSRYGVGDAYGAHVDDALMGDPPLRSDLAFTLFLSDPEHYDGGALTIAAPAGDQSIRLEPGDAVLYEATSVHEVTPVTRGERLAAVGWVQSFVRDPRQREVLFDIAQARAAPELDRATRLQLAKVQSNLLRMWAET